MQATSDKTASANFTQTGYSTNIRGIANNLSNGKTGYHLFYQWGRKDPFRSAEYTDDPAEGTTLVYKVDSVSVGMTIKNPIIHYFYKNMPYHPFCYNAWSAKCTSYSGTTDPGENNEFELVVKTVYDPSPVGYTVTPGNTFAAFTKDNFPVDGAGRVYTINEKTLYIPLAGQRYQTTGKVSYLDYGQYWVSIMGTASYGRILYFTSGGVSACYVSSGLALSKSQPIRPVREN